MIVQIIRLETLVGVWRELCEQCALLAPRQFEGNSSLEDYLEPLNPTGSHPLRDNPECNMWVQITARSNTMGPGHKHIHKRTTNVQDRVHR